MNKRSVSRLYAASAFVSVASIVVLPVAASAAVATAITTINANVGSTISVSSTSTVTLNITPVAGGSQTSASDTVTVSTNNAAGYNLALNDADGTTTLTSGGGATIAAHSGTFASPSALANNTWGYAVPSGTAGITTPNGFDASYTTVDNANSHASKWAGITTSPQVLRSTGAPVSGETTTVWYSAKVDTSKPNGMYSDTVTYTATTN